jgi:type II secretory pathway pseudopilin PulG
MKMTSASHALARDRGLVMLALLIALALASIALLAGLDVWAFEKQRKQEEELLFVGNQYRLAIQRYYLAGRSLPASIDDLLEDKRFPVPLHHLRRAYPDPLTGNNEWRFLRDGDRIYGVYSSSDRVPIKRANFPRRYAFFANAQTYGDWKFFYPPPGWRNNASTGAPLTPSTSSSFILTPGSPVH